MPCQPPTAAVPVLIIPTGVSSHCHQVYKRGILGTDSKGHPGEETRQEDVRGRELWVSPSFYKVVVECLVMLPESSIQEAQSKARAECFVTEALMV